MDGDGNAGTLDLHGTSHGVPERRVSLLIYHRDGAHVVPLAPGQSVVIGRAPPADVCIPDQSLSRSHLRVAYFQDEVMIEDLESTNGTRVNGEAVTLSQIKPGDQISLGSATAALHTLGPGEEQPQLEGLDSHDLFDQLLQHEVLRARGLGRGLALLVVRAADRSGGHVTQWFPAVRKLLRPFDRVSLYGPNALEVLVPEAGREETVRLAAQLAGQGQTPLLCGIARFPADAASAGELTQRARAAALRATPDGPVVLAQVDGPSSGRASSPTIPVATSPAMHAVLDTVGRVAPTRVSVLIYGETGVGKELVARAIHEQSPRRAQPMQAINCAGIPSQLLESVLFGHERGAFTGADRRSRGLFEEADGGTVFLDEVAELSAAAQAALLRVLETRQLTRVGSHELVAVDIRVVAATHRDLEAMCTAGTFREDLLYRLNTMTIQIPPLRERPEEIAALVQLFLEQANRDNDRQVMEIDPDALDLLGAYRWPGNVRELRNVIERAVVIAPAEVVSPADLPPRLRMPSGRPGVAEVEDEEGNLRERVKDYEAKLIREALAQAGGNQTEASRALEIPRRTLVRKIRDYGLKT